MKRVGHCSLLVRLLPVGGAGVLGKHILSPFKPSIQELVTDFLNRGDKYNVSARDFKDHVSVLIIDETGSDGLYGLHTLEITGNYISATGGKEIDVHGIEIEVLSPTRLRFWMNNHRPPVDANGNLLDGKKVGANSTIEVFEHTRGSKTLEHVKTIFHEAVSTPNGLLADGTGGVYITNDHDSKTGKVFNFPSTLQASFPGFFLLSLTHSPQFRFLEMISGGGSLTYCTLAGECHLAYTQGFKFANGITGVFSPRNAPNSAEENNSSTIYVANSAKGFISTYTPFLNGTLIRGPDIPLGIPVDNLSIDSNGDIFAACFPDVLALVANLDGPILEKGNRREIASTVLRIRRVADEEGEVRHVVKKVLEDIEGRVLPGATTAVHDVKTGMFWLGGVASPFVTVCERVGGEDAVK